MAREIVIYSRASDLSVHMLRQELIHELEAWGYSTSGDAADLRSVDFAVMHEEQWTDTGQEAIALVAAGDSILDDRLSSMNANEYWGIRPPVKGVWIRQVELFKYRFVQFQFSPLCYVQVMNRGSMAGMVGYLTSWFSGGRGEMEQ